ncbi:MAG: exodeoxyribonuclease V subunit gamma [Spirochaetota bacterium]
MIHLHTSNNLEYLSQILGEHLFRGKKDILSQHTVIVQSLGMQRWISLKIAEQFGVFTNCRFPFPENFAQEIYRAVIPDYELSPLYTNKALVWLLFSILPQCINEKPFEQVKNYLMVDGTVSQMRLYQLAHRLAKLYDEYVVYFYKDILQWEKNPTTQWQVLLWHYIKNTIADSKMCHKAQILEYALKALLDSKNTQALKEKLPGEVFLFGITVLPEYYITLFNAISSIVDVHIFQLNPSKEYWFDVRTEKTILRIKQKIKSKRISIDDLHLETGNPLLALLGKVGQEYIGMLLDYNVKENINDESNYTVPPNNTLLANIQNDIYNCIARGKGEHKKLEVKPDDRSITIHSCHSPLREVEVLRDYIIDILSTSSVLPNDIVVMAPDIDVYAPFIKAVFDEEVMKKEGLPVLPFCIADQSFKNTSRFISAFSDLHTVLAGRLEADKVCGLLDYDEIAIKFGIGKEGVMAFCQWVEKLNVKWGKDATHRAQYTNTQSNAFTWQYAIERLLMGYAIPQATGLVDDIIPFDSVEGLQSEVLGCCINFLNTLFYFFDEAQKPKSLERWLDYCDNCIHTMLDIENHSRDYETIQELFSSLRAIVPDINRNEDIEFLVIKSWIDDFLDEQRVSSNFLSKGITFCQLLPMRSIPFKVVCLLGMNDGQFPRMDENISFDIMRNEKYKDSLPRCIRSKRNDDRYLFLESIISAKEYLFISYQGQSPIDLSVKEPSIVVNELLEYIEQGYYIQGEKGNKIKDFLITKHHLHHFHPEYFNTHSKYFSYSKMWLDESKTLCGQKQNYQPLIVKSLQSNIQNTAITMDELITFFYNPSRYFIKKVLGINFNDTVIELDSDELLGVTDGLDEYRLNNELVTWCLDGKDIQQFAIFKKKEGSVPDAILGDVIIKKAHDEVSYFVDTVKRYCTGKMSSDELQYHYNNRITLTGKPDLYEGKQVFCRYSALKPKDRLKAFLWHIFVCVTLEPGITTYVITKDRKDPVLYINIKAEKAKEFLDACIDLFIEGNRRIIPFFPNLSQEFYKSKQSTRSSDEYIEYNLESLFYGRVDETYNQSEYSDPYVKRALYKVNIFNDEALYTEFKDISTKIFSMIDECEVKNDKDE